MAEIAEAAPLSRETLDRAIEQLRDAVPVCHPHVVHPSEWARGGHALCANCGGLVDLGPRP